MRIDILTLFPDMFDSLKQSIVKRAKAKGVVEINIINIRDFAAGKHKQCDDYPFGGGVGMVMMAEPIYNAIKTIKKENSHVIYMSPKGETLTQKKVKQLSTYEHLILLCGHYEGIDERVIELCVSEEISIGDYILTGGELAAEVLTDAVVRYIPGVLGDINSTADESFSNNMLEYPQYTRPAEFMGLKVPEVLLSGNHAQIQKWKKEQALAVTKKRRKDLL